MKTHPALLLCLGAGLSAILTGCIVETPAPHANASHTVTTYSSGHVVRTLPSGYRTETIGGVRYYNSGDTYYRPDRRGYVVVDAPGPRPRPRYDRPAVRREVVVTTLPSGYRTVEHRRVRYFESNGVYYQRRGQGYVMVDSPY